MCSGLCFSDFSDKHLCEEVQGILCLNFIQMCTAGILYWYSWLPPGRCIFRLLQKMVECSLSRHYQHNGLLSSSDSMPEVCGWDKGGNHSVYGVCLRNLVLRLLILMKVLRCAWYWDVIIILGGGYSAEFSHGGDNGIRTASCNCSVPSQLRAKMHKKSPSVMAFWLVCLGILTYSCQNTSRDSGYWIVTFVFLLATATEK